MPLLICEFYFALNERTATAVDSSAQLHRPAAAARSSTAAAACRRPKIPPTVSEFDRRQPVLSQMPCQELTQLHAVQSPEPPAWHTARPTIT